VQRSSYPLITRRRFRDFDNDGAWTRCQRPERPQLFRNLTPHISLLGVKLSGTHSNRQAWRKDYLQLPMPHLYNHALQVLDMLLYEPSFDLEW